MDAIQGEAEHEIGEIEADYVIAGCGAVGMAFADVVLSETDAQIAIIDRHAKPGGHWNDAYPFVTLHQPSAFYGVSSTELSRGVKDQVGLNKGLFDLASGAEISAYFEQVMRERFLPSGRVRYYPMCDAQTADLEADPRGGRTLRFQNRLSGARGVAKARRRLVDATHLKTSVPSTHNPNFRIEPGVWFAPLNDLPRIERAPAGYVVIGGGKTGIDACLWLLEQGAPAEAIRWITPRDAWLLDRRNMQPGLEFFERSMGAIASQFEAIAAAESVTDMFDRLEACGYLLRLDPAVRPTMFHGATISRAELEELRRIKQVIRLGRVQALETDRILLDDGALPSTPDHLHIDCSARAISNAALKPIFDGARITLQMVRPYQPVFSAGFIAHIEAAYSDEAEKNRLCGLVPLPNHDTDFIRFTAAGMMNQYHWSQDAQLRAWLRGNRLDGFSAMIKSLAPDDHARRALIDRMRAAAPLAMGKLQEFLADIEAEGCAHG
ncbi:MAG: NAD(P)/FAD-dependent oxidoreductase [Pseudomonadota bacterium]